MNKITVKVTDAVLDVKISPQSTTLTAGESTEVDVTLKKYRKYKPEKYCSVRQQ